MSLGPEFKHRTTLALPVVKAMQRMSRSVTIRQSYNSTPGVDGSRRWCVDTSTSEEQEFDTIQDAMAYARGGG